jgi:hypothetical protein
MHYCLFLLAVSFNGIEHDHCADIFLHRYVIHVGIPWHNLLCLIQ